MTGVHTRHRRPCKNALNGLEPRTAGHGARPERGHLGELRSLDHLGTVQMVPSKAATEAVLTMVPHSPSSPR